MTSEAVICLMKTVSQNIIEVTNVTVTITTVFVMLVLIVIAIVTVLITYYFIKRRTVTRRVGMAPAALIAATMGKVSVPITCGKQNFFSVSMLTLTLIYPPISHNRVGMKMSI